MEPTQLVAVTLVAVSLVWTLPLALGMALGAVVAPPDAVAATSLAASVALRRNGRRGGRGGDLMGTLGVAGFVIVLLVAILFTAMPPRLWTFRSRHRRRADQAEKTAARFDNVTEEDFAQRAANFRQLGMKMSLVKSFTRGSRASLGIVTEGDNATRDRLSMGGTGAGEGRKGGVRESFQMS